MKTSNLLVITGVAALTTLAFFKRKRLKYVVAPEVVFPIAHDAETGVLVESGTLLTWRAAAKDHSIHIHFPHESPCKCKQSDLYGTGEVSCVARTTREGTVLVVGEVTITTQQGYSHCHFYAC